MLKGRVRTALFLFGCSLVILGCGGDGIKRVRVEGMATAAGEPIDNATVIFMPLDNKTKGEGAIARTDSTGKYILMGSREGTIGIAPGEYRVRLSRIIDNRGEVLPAEAKQADHPTAKESIPSSYSTPDSKLKINISEAGGQTDLKIPEKLIKK